MNLLIIIVTVFKIIYTRANKRRPPQFSCFVEKMYRHKDVMIMYRLFNVLCWLWNIYEGAELPSVYFITNTKHCITYLALTQLFPVLVSHPEMYTLHVCSILLHFVSFLL